MKLFKVLLAALVVAAGVQAQYIWTPSNYKTYQVTDGVVGGISGETNYTYDENGRALSFVQTDNNGEVVLSYQYTYDGNGRTSQLVTIVNNVRTETNYTYDSKGRTISTISIRTANGSSGSSDNDRTEANYTYDSEDRTLSAISIRTLTVNGSQSYSIRTETNYTYDSKGRTMSNVQTSTTTSNGNTANTRTEANYTYDAKDRTLSIITTSTAANGDVTSNTRTYTYDSEDRKLSATIQQTYATGLVATTDSSYTYDSKGRTLSIIVTQTSTSGDVSNVTSTETNYTLDYETGIPLKNVVAATAANGNVTNTETNYTIELVSTGSDFKIYKQYVTTTAGTGQPAHYKVQNGIPQAISVDISYTYPDNSIIRAKLPDLTLSNYTYYYAAQESNSSYQTCELVSDSETRLTIRIKTYQTTTGMLTGQYETTYIRFADNTSIAKTAANKKITVGFAGIRNGQINLNLNAGTYTAQLYNLQGRLIRKADITATNGVNATGLRTDNLSQGIFILNVKQAGASVLQHKIMIK
jgi:YD repeat-containing protein